MIILEIKHACYSAVYPFDHIVEIGVDGVDSYVVFDGSNYSSFYVIFPLIFFNPPKMIG